MVVIDSTNPVYPYIIFHHMLSGTPVPHNIVSWDTKHKRGVRAKHTHESEHKGLVFEQKRLAPGQTDKSPIRVQLESFQSKHIIPIIKVPKTKYIELKRFIDEIQFAEDSDRIVIEILDEFINRPKSQALEPQ